MLTPFSIQSSLTRRQTDPRRSDLPACSSHAAMRPPPSSNLTLGPDLFYFQMAVASRPWLIGVKDMVTLLEPGRDRPKTNKHSENYVLYLNFHLMFTIRRTSVLHSRFDGDII